MQAFNHEILDNRHLQFLSMVWEILSRISNKKSHCRDKTSPSKCIYFQKSWLSFDSKINDFEHESKSMTIESTKSIV